MERIRVQREPLKRKIRPEVLRLDPRDPDIVRAKAAIARRASEDRAP